MKKLNFLLSACLAVAGVLPVVAADGGPRADIKPTFGARPERPINAWSMAPQGKTLERPLVRPAAIAPVPLADGDALQLYGNLIYRSEWTENNCGIYSFTVTADGQPSAIDVNKLYANGGATYVPDGHYYVAALYSTAMGMASDPRLAIYDADTWECFGELYADFSIMGYDLCYNPQDKKIYGCFFDNFGSSNAAHLGTLNMWEGEHKRIASLAEPLMALTCTGDGVFYGIAGGSGNVYRLTADGASEMIGTTGLHPNYLQSATYDYRTKQIYWCATTDDTAGLYTIDQADGHATLVADWTGHLDEWVGVFSRTPYAKDGAPDECSGLSVEFEGPSLTGQVSFTLPATTFGGTAIDGDVTYVVMVNGSEALTGQAAAGSTCTVELTTTEGNRTIGVVARNDEGDSPVQEVAVYVGNDMPAAPANIVATPTADGVSIVWDAVATGHNGGYVDTSTLTYTVTRKPDYEVIAENITDTHVIDTIELGDYALYTYEVEANTADRYGRAGTSNGLHMGQAYQAPFQSNFANARHRQLYIIEDANDDDNTWSEYNLSGSTVYRYRYSYQGNAADDWLFTPPFALEEGKLYRITNTAFSTGRTERMEVMAGLSADSKAMTETVMAAYDLPQEVYDNNDTTAVYFRPQASADYFFGFHAVSVPNQFFLIMPTWTIEEAVDAKAPAAAGVELLAGPKGELKATLTITAPVADVDGNKLTALDSAVVVNYTTGQTLATLEAPEPGRQYTVTDAEPEHDVNLYAVTFANEAGRGIVNTVRAFVGNDSPVELAGVHWTQQGDEAVISWEPAMGEGLNGGYVDTDDVTYTVVKFNPIKVLARGLTECTYTHRPDVDEGGQSFIYYTVYAVSNDKFGESSNTQGAPFGTGYALPFVESFPDGELQNKGWGFSNAGLNTTFDTSWTVYYEGWSTALAPQDGDNGMLVMRPNGGGECTIVSPLISLEGATAPVLKFFANRSAEQNDCQLLVSEDSGNHWSTLADIDVNGVGQWTEYSVPLTDYVGKTVCLGFHADASYIYSEVAIDNVTLTDGSAVGISSVTAPQTGDVYTLTGVRVRTQATSLSGLPKGAYIVNGRKVIVR